MRLCWLKGGGDIRVLNLMEFPVGLRTALAIVFRTVFRGCSNPLVKQNGVECRRDVLVFQPESGL